MSEAVVIDGVLKEIGDRLFYEPVRPVRVKRTVTGTWNTSSFPSKHRFIPVVRARGTLSRTVRRVPEVMVKISGNGRGMKRIAAHMEYISRNGTVELEDQYGEIIIGREGVNDLLAEFRYGGFPIPEGSSKRETFNIVLSMPPGTDRAAVTNAAREFAREEFSGNFSYAFATHTDEKHPHVHLCVKAMGRDGTRLNPRKADLQSWREIFAEKLRDNGIEANATRRPVRGVTRKAKQQQAIHIKRRGEVPLNERGQKEAVIKVIKGEAALANPVAAKIQATRKHVETLYQGAISILRTSTNPDDQELARQVENFARTVPPAETTRDAVIREYQEHRHAGQAKSAEKEVVGNKKVGRERE